MDDVGDVPPLRLACTDLGMRELYVPATDMAEES